MFYQIRLPQTNLYERDWSKFKQENFIIDYFDKYWTDLIQIDQQNANLSTDYFLKNINSILDTHALLKKFININKSFKQNPGLLLPFRNPFLLKKNS